MAFSLKVTGYSRKDGRALMEIEPNWWDAQELMQDRRFAEPQQQGRFQHYHADLSLDEMRELHDRYKGNVTTIQRWLCFRFKKLSPPCRELHHALHRRSRNYSHFHVNVFEWESGL